MDQVGSLLDRPKLYYNIDGVGELRGGFTMLGFALLMWLQAHSPSGAIWHQMYAFVVYMAVMFSIIHYGTKAIKNHITYPPTGFVEYRKPGKRCLVLRQGRSLEMGCRLRNDTRLICDRIPFREFVRHAGR